MFIQFDSLPVNGFGISLTIHNLTFAGNSLPGGDFFNSTFIQNAAHCGQSTAVYISAPVDPKVYQVTLMSTIFHRNFMLTDTLQREHHCAVLCLRYVKNITIVNSTFSDNNCTSVIAESSIFHLQGTVEFYRNTAYSGGALAFYHDAHCESKQTVRIENSMILNPHTSVYIINNTAVQYGGGILADEECKKGRYCFFQIGNLNYTQMDTKVIMEGNRAGKAGDSIFAWRLSQLLLSENKKVLTPKTFSSLFQINGQTQSEVAASLRKFASVMDIS